MINIVSQLRRQCYKNTRMHELHWLWLSCCNSTTHYSSTDSQTRTPTSHWLIVSTKQCCYIIGPATHIDDVVSSEIVLVLHTTCTQTQGGKLPEPSFPASLHTPIFDLPTSLVIHLDLQYNINLNLPSHTCLCTCTAQPRCAIANAIQTRIPCVSASAPTCRLVLPTAKSNINDITSI